MKKVLLQKVNDLFRPNNVLDIDVYEVLDSLGDGVVRKKWLFEVLSEIKRINLEIDRVLVSGKPLTETILTDLSGRRRALKFVLDEALSAKREIHRTRGQNQADKGTLDLDSVTLQSGM